MKVNSVKKVLITGSNGFIGKNLQEFYKDKYDILTANRNDDIEYKLKNDRPDFIFHCASEIYNDSLMFDSNIIYTKKILDYCKIYGIEKLITLGSSSEYGSKNNPMREVDFLDPRTMYEATKAASSMLVHGYSRAYNIRSVIIRPFTVVGRNEKNHKFFPTLYKSWKLEKEINLSNAVHDFVFIDDFLLAFDIILNNNENVFDVINIGSGYKTTNYEIVNTFEQVTNYKYKKNLVDKLRPFDNFNWVADIDKLKTKYGIVITNNVDSYLKNGITKFINDCERLNLYV